MFASTLIFLGILVVLVVVHEFGHFIVAKLFGIRVDEFAFGFPPKLFGKKFGETEYQINLLPIGGYVKIYGEDPSTVTEGSDKARSFAHKPRYVQAAVLLAGVTMNLICAWVLFFAAYTLGAETTRQAAGDIQLQNERTMVVQVAENSPVALAGIQIRDTIISLNAGKDTLVPVASADVSSFVKTHADVPIAITYQSQSENSPRTATVTPIVMQGSDTKRIGLGVDRVGVAELSFIEAVKQSSVTTYTVTRDTLGAFITLITGIFSGTSGTENLAGPIGIVSIVDRIKDAGVPALLVFAAIISVNLAVLNLIPFPALDGGRLLFVAIEAVIRRPLPIAFQGWVNTIGFGLLLLLMLVVTWGDIARLM